MLERNSDERGMLGVAMGVGVGLAVGRGADWVAAAVGVAVSVAEADAMRVGVPDRRIADTDRDDPAAVRVFVTNAVLVSVFDATSSPVRVSDAVSGAHRLKVQTASVAAKRVTCCGGGCWNAGESVGEGCAGTAGDISGQLYD